MNEFYEVLEKYLTIRLSSTQCIKVMRVQLPDSKEPFIAIQKFWKKEGTEENWRIGKGIHLETEDALQVATAIINGLSGV